MTLLGTADSLFSCLKEKTTLSSDDHEGLEISLPDSVSSMIIWICTLFTASRWTLHMLNIVNKIFIVSNIQKV